jgi:hypothetical protein
MGNRTDTLPKILRAPRTAALWVLAATIPLATAAAFALSYRGLVVYALAGGEPPWLAVVYPLILDLPVIAGEVVLFVAAIEGDTPRRVRAYAWVVTVAFAVLSVAANAGYLPVRAGRGLPPAVLAILLGFGLGELKRQAAKYRAPGRTVLAAPFTDAQTAAADALARTVEAGNPLSQRQLMTRFRLTRGEETKVRDLVLAPMDGGRDAASPPTGVPATLNGSAPHE